MKTECDMRCDELTNPPPEFSPAYFWSLNDALDEKVMLEQLRDMFAHGVRSVCIHPMPPEFRPETMATAMTPPYLSDDYFRLIRRMVEECAALGMRFYLYDEAAWPSGSAAGRVYARNPGKFARKHVGFDEIKVEPGKKYLIAADALSAALRGPAGINHITAPGTEISAGTDDLTLRIFRVKNEPLPSWCPPKPDLLCPQAAQTFIELTHANYAKHVGDWFGGVIKFAFTDEPDATLTHLPRKGNWQLTWTDDLAEVFLREKGYDIIPYFPHFFEEKRGLDTTRALLDFYDVWSGLFAERYLRPLKEWCRHNKILSGGHMGGEDELLYNADAGFGHILRALRELDLPGVDAIWRQIYPGNPETLVYPKYAQSVARQNGGQELVLSESFMVYGNGLTPAEMKWITDQQLVLGVNIFVLGHYAYSTRDHFMPFARPFFGPVNPFWKYLDKYHAYTARMGYLLSRGKADCATAVYYPIRDIWAGAAYRENAMAFHNHIAATLLQNQCEYDYVDDDLLKTENIRNNCLCLGKASYSTIIVPKSEWLTAGALKCLADFVKNGGRLIAAGGLPGADGGKATLTRISHTPREKCARRAEVEALCTSLRGCPEATFRLLRPAPMPSQGIGRPALISQPDLGCEISGLTASADEPIGPGASGIKQGAGTIIVEDAVKVAEHVAPLARINPRQPAMRICKRLCDNAHVYFLANPDDREIEAEFCFPETNAALLCDMVENSFLRLEHSPGGRGNFHLRFAPWESRVIIFTSQPETFKPSGRYFSGTYREIMRLAAGWQLRPRRRYAVGKHNYEITELPETPFMPVDPGDWRRHLGNDFSGDAEYRVEFDFQDPGAGTIILDLGQVHYAAAVTLNGQDLGHVIWQPFRINAAGAIHPGRNVLRLTVTNSLANAVMAEGVAETWQKQCGHEWPAIKFVFDERQRKFEKDSLAGGLFGPVRLLREQAPAEGRL